MSRYLWKEVMLTAIGRVKGRTHEHIIYPGHLHQGMAHCTRNLAEQATQLRRLQALEQEYVDFAQQHTQRYAALEAKVDDALRRIAELELQYEPMLRDFAEWKERVTRLYADQLHAEQNIETLRTRNGQLLLAVPEFCTLTAMPMGARIMDAKGNQIGSGHLVSRAGFVVTARHCVTSKTNVGEHINCDLRCNVNGVSYSCDRAYVHNDANVGIALLHLRGWKAPSPQDPPSLSLTKQLPELGSNVFGLTADVVSEPDTPPRQGTFVSVQKFWGFRDGLCRVSGGLCTMGRPGSAVGFGDKVFAIATDLRVPGAQPNPVPDVTEQVSHEAGLAPENISSVACPLYPHWGHTRWIEVELLKEAGLAPIPEGTALVKLSDLVPAS
jgi:FtsZ-binding cell division protein ZapB